MLEKKMRRRVEIAKKMVYARRNKEVGEAEKVSICISFTAHSLTSLSSFALPFPLPFLGFSSLTPSSWSLSVRRDDFRMPGKSFDEYTRKGSDQASARMGCGVPVSTTLPQSINRNLSLYMPAWRTERSAKTKNVAGVAESVDCEAPAAVVLLDRYAGAVAGSGSWST
jgi:hypothetical protein